MRMRLPNRRPALTESIRWPLEGGRRVHVRAGFDPATAEVREVFIRGGSQVGSERDMLLDDLAVLMSLLLQSGYSPRDLVGRVGRQPGERPASIVGAVLDLLVKFDGDVRA